MTVATRVFLVVLAVGAALWVALIALTPSPITLSNPIVPLFAFLTGIFLASLVFPWAAQKWPNSLLAKGNQVPFSTRQVVFFVGFALGLLYMFAAH